MAIKPIYAQRVQEASQPTVRQNLRGTNDLAQLGGAVNQLVQSGVGVAVKVVNSMDSAALMEADAKVGAAWQARQAELQEQKGKAAGEYTKVAEKNWAQDMDAVEEGLNPRQKAQFQRIRQKRTEAWNMSVQSHVNREGERYAEEAYGSVLTMASNNAAVAASDPGSDGVVNEFAVTMRDAIDARGSALGWSDEKLAAEKLARMTPMHGAVVEAMIERGESTGARDYIGAMRRSKEIDAGVAQQLEKKIGNKDREVESVRLAQEITWNNSTSQWIVDVDAAKKEATQRITAEPNYDPLKLKATHHEIDQIASAKIRARDMHDSPLVAQVAEKIYSGKSVNTSSGEVADILDELSPEGRGDALRLIYADQRNKSNDVAARAAQAAFNKFGQSVWNRMPIEEKVKLNPIIDPVLGNADIVTRNNIEGERQKLAKAFEKDNGQTFKQMEKELLSLLKLEGASKRLQDDALSHFAQQLADLSSANPGKTYFTGPEAKELREYWKSKKVVPGLIFDDEESQLMLDIAAQREGKGPAILSEREKAAARATIMKANPALGEPSPEAIKELAMRVRAGFTPQEPRREGR